MDNVEMAQEGLEHAHAHAGAGHAQPAGTRSAAILVAVFAALAVILEMAANDAQTTYLARTITASDVWAEYQAKSVRRTLRDQAADTLEALGTGPAATAAIAAAVAHARAEAARLADEPGADGMRQLADRARGDEAERDRALHLHEQMERAVRVLQIAIVLVGLYLATRLAALAGLGLVLGLAAIAWGLVAAIGIV